MEYVNQPLTISHLQPGKNAEITWTVQNTSDREAVGAVETENVLSAEELHQNITIEITDTAHAQQIIYGPATLQQFAKDGYIVLSPIPPHGSTTYRLTYHLNENAPGELQLQSTAFDIKIGVEEKPDARITTVSLPLSASPLPTPNIQKTNVVKQIDGDILGTSTASSILLSTQPPADIVSNMKNFAQISSIFLAGALGLIALALSIRALFLHRALRKL